MKGLIAFEAIGNVSDDLVMEAVDMLGLLKAPAVTPRSSVKDTPRHRFFSSGWGVACISLLVALGVLSAIIYAGRQGPPTVIPGDTVTEETVSDGAVSDETASDETASDEVETSPDTPRETDSETDPIPSCEEGHAVEVWETLREATCYIVGEQKGICARCDGVIYETPERLSHVHEHGYCTVCGMVQGADERFVMQGRNEEDGTRGAIILRRDGAEGEQIILPNVYFDVQTNTMVPVTVIGSGLFKYDSQLRDIEFPDTVHTIGANAFDHCESLRTPRWPVALKHIESMAFTATALTNLNLPDGLLSVGNMAFGYCPGLSKVELPAELSQLDAQAFAYCENLFHMVLPRSITALEDGLFQGCASLSHLEIPADILRVGNSVFYGCASLTEVTLPDTVTSMGYHVFLGCSSLTSFTVPPQVTKISNNQFESCTALTEVILHDGITTVEAAFWNCTSLESFHLPASVTNLSSIAFEGCTSLRTLTVADGNPVYTASGNCIIERDKKTLVVGGLEAVIPTDGSVTAISAGAFRGRGIRRLTIPDTVTVIGDSAFAECRQLSEITLPASLTELGSYAFHDCVALEAVTLPASLETVGYNLFEGCTRLHTLTIPGGLTAMGTCLLVECKAITRVNYGGTTAQWQALTQDVSFGTLEQPHSAFTVYCTDGEISVESPHLP